MVDLDVYQNLFADLAKAPLRVLVTVDVPALDQAEPFWALHSVAPDDGLWIVGATTPESFGYDDGSGSFCMLNVGLRNRARLEPGHILMVPVPARQEYGLLFTNGGREDRRVRSEACQVHLIGVTGYNPLSWCINHWTRKH